MVITPIEPLFGTRFRDAVTGMLHGPVRWPHGTTPAPFGCRWCGTERRAHAFGPKSLSKRGPHLWVQPTQAQIKARMQARRAARNAVCRCDPMGYLPRSLPSWTRTGARQTTGSPLTCADHRETA